MHSFKIISDSSCDLSDKLIKQYDISIVSYRVTLDGENYFKENVDMPVKDFYHALRTQNVFPRTSLPPIQDYVDVFKAALDNGQDIICFNLTSKFSGSCQSAENAKNILLEDYPGAKIIVVDSMLATGPQGALVLEAARMREHGLSIEQVNENCQKLIKTSRVYLTVETLKYLQKGGRIGKVNAFVGSLLNIQPLIMLDDGELIPHSKVRGRKKAISKIIALFKADIGDRTDDYSLMLLHTDALAEVAKLRQIVEKDFGSEVSFSVVDVGVTIGAHIGPTVIGIGYIKKYEKL